jgi:glycosyltransferase involved in cell wall biosynthesis
MRGDPVTPVPFGTERPFWSVVIPCYNASEWLPQSLGCVLQQDPGPEQMEILVVDDCSTLGNPAHITDQLGSGRVKFLRQEKNVGKSRNFATGIAAAAGQWIHILHADDRVDHGFYAEMQKVISAFPSSGAVFCEARYIDASGRSIGRTGQELTHSGVIPDFASRLYVAQRIQTPSMVVRRSVYEQLGTFRDDLLLTEDWEMWLRIAVHYDIGFCTLTMADYRVFDSNSSVLASLDGRWFMDLKRLAAITDELVPPEVRERFSSQRNLEIAIFIASFLPRLLNEKKTMAAMSCITKALTWSRHPTVLRKIAGVLLRRLILSNKAA